MRNYGVRPIDVMLGCCRWAGAVRRLGQRRRGSLSVRRSTRTPSRCCAGGAAAKRARDWSSSSPGSPARASRQSPGDWSTGCTRPTGPSRCSTATSHGACCRPVSASAATTATPTSAGSVGSAQRSRATAGWPCWHRSRRSRRLGPRCAAWSSRTVTSCWSGSHAAGGVRAPRPQGPVRQGAARGDPRLHRHLVAVRGTGRRRPGDRHDRHQRRGRRRRRCGTTWSTADGSARHLLEFRRRRGPTHPLACRFARTCR